MLLIQQYLWPSGILEFQNFRTEEKTHSIEVTEHMAHLRLVCVLLVQQGASPVL